MSSSLKKRMLTAGNSFTSMSDPEERKRDDRWVRSLRGPKMAVDPFRPYHTLIERERTPGGGAEEVITLFLTNRECGFTCLMCDLWKFTTDATVPAGAIPEQIQWALERLPPAKHIKLYNSANFFDPRAVPPEDYPRIAELLYPFETVIVENHPLLTGENVTRFARLLRPRLQVAMGLETIQPDMLQRLGKKLEPDDYRRAVGWLSEHGIGTRTFILLKPPFVTEKEGIEWALSSLEYAFGAGSDCCTVIPVRSGNGAMDLLEREGAYSPPKLSSLEEVQSRGIGMGLGDVYADTWDLRLFSDCSKCFESRKERMERMNLEQAILPLIECTCQLKQ
jgi:radical SAM enzyme (TIGR01210 family)